MATELSRKYNRAFALFQAMTRYSSSRLTLRPALARLLAACGLLVGGASTAQAQGFAPPADLVTVPPIAPLTIAPGATTPAKITLKIKDGFHIQANPASEDYLIPTEVTLTVDNKVFKLGKPVYPAPISLKTKLSVKPLKVYEGNSDITVPLTVLPATKPGTYTLKGSVSFQACNDTNCFPPGEAAVALKIVVGDKPAPGGAPIPKNAGTTPGTTQAGGTQSGATQTTTPDNTATGTVGTGTTSTNAVTTGTATTSTISKAGDAAAIQRQFNVGSLPTVVFLGQNGQERSDLRLGEGKAELLTLGDMKTRLSALKNGGAFTNAPAEENQGFLAHWTNKLTSLFKTSSLPLQLLLAFAGGLLLNLTPCVYPMIPITVGFFGTQSDGRMSRTLTLGLCYMLGLALVYSALGLFAALTGTLFGSALQSRWVTGIVALILGAFALSMLGVFTIQPPMWLMSRGGSKKGAWGALGMGAMLGVVAAPCVGPFVGALLAYVTAQQQVALGFALLFALSIGLGLPYLVLGAFSGSVKALPRSGKWMETTKKVFAAPLVLAALWFGYLALKPASAMAADGWQPATLAGIKAAQASGKPVVLDFRADWCLPCRDLEDKVFSKPDVTSQSGDVTLMRVDLTSATS